MPQILFYLSAAVAVIFALGVVLNRNPVASALCLVVSFLGLASLYLSLNAYLIGVIQILVYAGAIMVLFLFIIMLLDLKVEERRKLRFPVLMGGGLTFVAFVFLLMSVLWNFNRGDVTVQNVPIDYVAAHQYKEKTSTPSLVADLKASRLNDVKLVGESLFGDYIFHVQLVGLLLLASTIGVVVLSKRSGTEELK